MKMDRRAYADHYGPTTRRPHSPGGHRAPGPRRARPDDVWRRSHLRRRQGDPRRDGAVADRHPCRRRARSGHHLGGHRRQRRHLQGGRRHPRRPHLRHRQGRQPGHHGRRDGGPRNRRIDRSARRRGQDPDCGRDRHAHPLHLAESDSRCVPLGHHDPHRRRHGAGNRHQRDDLHTGVVVSPADVRSGRRVSAQLRLSRQGQLLERRAAERADSRRRDRVEAARGLGHDAGCHRSVFEGRRRIRRAGGDSLRHAQRGRLRRRHHRGHRRTHHSQLSHRRRRRRPRARHHPSLRRGQRPALVHESDDAVHAEYPG